MATEQKGRSWAMHRWRKQPEILGDSSVVYDVVYTAGDSSQPVRLHAYCEEHADRLVAELNDCVGVTY